MKVLKAIIIDDELHGRETLKSLIEEYCVGVVVVDTAADVKSGVQAIWDKTPDLVFLDIEMPKQNGFQLFNYFKNPDFDVIFTTAYSEYAVKAFRLSAIDYLLKPINTNDLREAIEKIRVKERLLGEQNKYGVFVDNLNNVITKMALPTLEGYKFVEIKDIIRCEADNNYTTFFFTDGRKTLVSKTLKQFDNFLSDFNFFRANRKDLVNLNYITSYERHRSPIISMEDGSQITLSENRKNDFLERIQL